MELRGDRVTLVEATPADAEAIHAVLGDPSVVRWWGENTLDDVRDRVLAPGSGLTSFRIVREGRTIGLLQVSEELDPEYRHAGIDLSLVEDAQGQGLGPDAIRAAARWLFGERGHHRLTIDPRASNAAAIAAYRKIGFRPVGVMRRYERGVDGTWHDGLLMDLLADELT